VRAPQRGLDSIANLLCMGLFLGVSCAPPPGFLARVINACACIMASVSVRLGAAAGPTLDSSAYRWLRPAKPDKIHADVSGASC